jgi:nickel superoxide dismutase
MKKTIIIAIALIALGTQAFAHCEIPCGIYGDRMRIDMIKEDLTTIEKGMKQITELSAQDPINYNQLVRWINVKEEHANKIHDIIYQYFMTQRVKPVTSPDAPGRNKYITQLTLLQQMLVSTMKCKQTTDLQHVQDTRALLDQFVDAYFEKQPNEEEAEEKMMSPMTEHHGHMH